MTCHIITILLLLNIITLPGCGRKDKSVDAENTKPSKEQVDATRADSETADGISTPPHIPKTPATNTVKLSPQQSADEKDTLFYDVHQSENPQLASLIKKAANSGVLYMNADQDFSPTTSVTADQLKEWLNAKQESVFRQKQQDVLRRSETQEPADQQSDQQTDSPTPATIKEKPELNVNYLSRFKGNETLNRGQLCELYASIRGATTQLHEMSSVIGHYQGIHHWEDAELIPSKQVACIAYAHEKGLIQSVFKSEHLPTEENYHFHPFASITREEALRFVMWLNI